MIRRSWPLFVIGALLIIGSTIVFDYMFDIALFSSENFRTYFVTCDVKYLPVGMHGALLMEPPCITQLFAPPFMINSVIATALVAAGIISLLFGFRFNNQFASPTLYK